MIITAPNRTTENLDDKLKIFLAGTIDNGDSFDFQKVLCDYAEKNLDIHVFNPRREKWNKDADEKELVEQIEWELDHMEMADYIIMNILPDSKSPISLLELGLWAKSGKLIIFCSKDFYRYENVRTTCEKYKVKLYSINDIDEIKLVMRMLKCMPRGIK